jgi:hypothetical protein
MEIHGWIAASKTDLILSSFRKNPNEANNAARQAIRLLGGPSLLTGFRLVQATLTIHDETIEKKQEAETKSC